MPLKQYCRNLNAAMAEINTLEEQVALSDIKTAAIGGQSAYLGADSQAGML